MKTNYVKLFGLFFVLIAFVSVVNAQGVKVGFVDSEIILKQLPESQKVLAELDGLKKLYIDTIQNKEKTLKSNAESFKARYEEAQKMVESGQIKSETDLKKLNEEIQILQKGLQEQDDALSSYKQKIQEELGQKQGEMFKPIKEKITKAIEGVAKEMKINFVFDKADGTLIYGDKEFDITFKVLDKLK
ncbi:MAG: OmpH family outer membrane protein [Ignavibacteriota bacterium]|nr:OmpH family outer membrane protein [Ignavibacteriota bacterium]